MRRSLGAILLQIEHEEFPSLKELGLIGVHAQFLIDETTVRGLRELTLFGKAEMAWFVDEVQKGHLDGLQSLTVHVDTYERGHFKLPKLPKHLRSLTLFMNFSWQGSDHPPEIEVHALQDLADCFNVATEECDGLQKVLVECGSYDGQDSSGFEAVVRTIDELCKPKGVCLDVRKYTKRTYVEEGTEIVDSYLQ